MTRHYKILHFKFKGSPYEVNLNRGLYFFEAWGASGIIEKCGRTFEARGRGAYASGTIKLKETIKIFVYVGQNPQASNNPSFNGNINKYSSPPGGGATDFRLEKGEFWYNLSSLKSRIMVAAGGGGTDCFSGGDGGTLEGKLPDNAGVLPGPGNQTHGGSAGAFGDRFGFPGEFGIGGSGDCYSCSNTDGAGGGGGGYYGGGGISLNGGGAGGSSFISGFEGCDAIEKETLAPTGSPIHYSGLFFKFGRMFAGDEEMPDYHYTSQNISQIGNRGHGFARITFLSPSQVTCKVRSPSPLSSAFALVFLLSS